MTKMPVRLRLQDNLTPYLGGIVAYAKSCGACCGELPAFPDCMSEVVTGKPNGIDMPVIIFPSKELVAWFGDYVALTKRDPSRPD